MKGSWSCNCLVLALFITLAISSIHSGQAARHLQDLSDFRQLPDSIAGAINDRPQPNLKDISDTIPTLEEIFNYLNRQSNSGTATP